MQTYDSVKLTLRWLNPTGQQPHLSVCTTLALNEGLILLLQRQDWLLLNLHKYEQTYSDVAKNMPGNIPCPAG